MMFPKLLSARMVAGLIACALFSVYSNQSSAQPADESSAPRATTHGYDKAHEVTLTGTIEEVVAKPAPGSPIGLHLLVETSSGVVDTHLGPYLAKEVKDALQTGTTVQIVGAMITAHGKDFLLARQLIFSGRLVTVRNANGFLLQAHATKGSQSEGNGGAQ